MVRGGNRRKPNVVPVEPEQTVEGEGEEVILDEDNREENVAETAEIPATTPNGQSQHRDDVAQTPFGNVPPPSSIKSTVTKLKEAKELFEKKKSEILEKIWDLEDKIIFKDIDEEKVHELLQRKQKQITSGDELPAEVLTTLETEVENLRERLREGRKEKRLWEREIKSLERAVSILQTEYETQCSRIDEAGEQYLGSDDEKTRDPYEKNRDPYEKDGDHDDKHRPESREEVPNHPAQDWSTQTLTQFASEVTSLAKVVADLKKNENSPSSSTTEKIMMRQSISRDLPTFRGFPEEWYPFVTSFKNTTELGGYTDAENVERLRKCLKGDAFKSVQSLLVSPESLPKIMELLETRYGQPTVIIESMLNQIRKMPMVKGNDPQTLIKFGTAVVNLVATIKNMGKIEDLKNPALLREFEKKLPSYLRDNWARKLLKKSRVETLESFADWIEVEVNLACRICPPIPTEDRQPKAKHNGHSDDKQVRGNREGTEEKFTEEQPTALGLFSKVQKKNQSSCVFCNSKSHRSSACLSVAKMPLEERRNIVKKKRACFKCLEIGHNAKDCQRKISCITCSRSHFAVMCPSQEENVQVAHVAAVEDEEETSVFCANVCGGGSEVLLHSLRVRIKAGTNEVDVRMVYDNCNQRSYIREDIANKLNLPTVGFETFKTGLFGGQVTEECTYTRREVWLQPLDKNQGRKFELLGKKKICTSIPSIPQGPWVTELQKMGISLTDVQSQDTEVQILIGNDYWGSLLTGRIRQLKCGLTAVETVLGWTLGGPVPREECSANLVVSMLAEEIPEQEWWKLDTIGIQDPITMKSKEEREQATKEHFLKTVTRNEDGRYRVSLPWVDGVQKIPTNRAVAEKMLKSSTIKLKKAGQLENYDNIFKSWNEEKMIEVVKEETEEGHYLPHHPVIKPESETTPVRPVFNGSYKVGRNPSLNECLEKGPNMLELIVSILHRFRMKKVGVISDIRKAFQMIEVDPADRDYLRFLWWEELRSERVKIYRHTRVPFGANCSPFLLAAVLHIHLTSISDHRKEIAMKLLESFYVDNSVLSLDTMEEYSVFKSTSIQLMEEAKMELRQWDYGPHEEDKKSKVLGLMWFQKEDYLTCVIPAKCNLDKMTKREVLSCVQKIYDPLGFLCPATVKPKMLLQAAWKRKISWDQEIPVDLKEEFLNFWTEVDKLAAIKIPRRVSMSEGLPNVQLHGFCDASEHAYAAAVFIKTEDDTGCSVQLIQAKARISPVEKASIPRLELLGCCILARLMTSVKSATKLEDVQTYLWTDSSTALAWIRRNDIWGTFVGNRVKEILKLTRVEEWRHVPGVQNPADLPSRGCTPGQLLESKWWEGPSWLKNSEKFWPRSEVKTNEDLVAAEKKKTVKVSAVALKSLSWNYGRFSTYTKTVRVIGWMMRIRRIQKEIPHGGKQLNPDEFIEAEKILWRLVQQDSFNSSDTTIGGVPVYLDKEDKLLKVKTKILHRQDEEGFRCPVLLPNSHPVVDMLIRWEHFRLHHGGVQLLMSSLRERVWILQSRRAVKKIVNRCVMCRRFCAKSPVTPTAPLPENRVKDAKVFEVIGIDLAGPLCLKDKSKAWIVLFTCAVYRAVHLEVVESLSTDVFILAFLRFMSRRGRPAVVYSDNGRNFLGANNLFATLDWEKIQEDQRLERIQWRFIPPSAPWWGGFWERLIRMVKDLMRKMLGHRKLSYVELETCVCEVESTVNLRPLTYISEDAEDLVALSPSHFLQEQSTTNEIPEAKALNAEQLQEKYKKLLKLREELKMRFRKEYLAQLVDKTKSKKTTNLSKDDIVLIGSDNKKRLDWPMGRIVELISGRDGSHRMAKVKTANGELLRPIQRLYLLEASSQDIPVIKKKDDVVVAELQGGSVENVEDSPDPGYV